MIFTRADRIMKLPDVLQTRRVVQCLPGCGLTTLSGTIVRNGYLSVNRMDELWGIGGRAHVVGSNHHIHGPDLIHGTHQLTFPAGSEVAQIENTKAPERNQKPER